MLHDGLADSLHELELVYRQAVAGRLIGHGIGADLVAVTGYDGYTSVESDPLLRGHIGTILKPRVKPEIRYDQSRRSVGLATFVASCAGICQAVFTDSIRTSDDGGAH
jgi:hypothetical protein